MINFKQILKSSQSKGFECCSVGKDGKVTNSAICEDMLEGGSASPECSAHLVALARTVGFSQVQAEKYWGHA